ncbi:heme-dependent oxidative N-demethylase family protein [Pseudotabrizicola sp. L79]|uniref:heme-dependent oxidative N-demethylase family protein n=1 Tax=Pseudotabrizicola sp. L79 TaxID=3118402 RepID=UPI002F937536
MDVILQKSLPFAPWADPRTRRLPGILPLDMADWLRVDDAYAAQMALRARLLAEREAEVVAELPDASAAVEELYAFVLAHLPPGFARAGDVVTRPDGVAVRLDPARKLWTLGHLVQEDLCLMQEDGAGEHLLSAALLCFPAGWRLAEKLGRAMMRIHAPVPKYTEDLGRRVQRLLDAVRVETPLWRANAHLSRAPLFNPLSEAAAKDTVDQGEMPYVRSERQCLIRLPQSRAVLFSIHTYVVRRCDLTAAQDAALEAFPIHRAE